MLNKILTFSYYILFALTPLFWTSVNYELFEYNKMMLVYLLTIIITAAWLLKMIKTKTLVLKKTPLDIFLLLFLLANILSTIFSIDTHTSIWGYYSRSNGGLLSIISYLLLYFALVGNFETPQVLKFLKAGLLGGLVVAFYAIPEHFGISPSCLILTGQADAACWVQDVQARVFATLGQPNWLAAYLGMLIFPALYFLTAAKSAQSRVYYSFLLIAFYLGFTFTYSRGATLGLVAGVVFLLASLTISIFRLHPGGVKLNLIQFKQYKPLMWILAGFIIISLFFGTALTSFKLISKFAPPPRAGITLTQTATTQLEAGGTESGQIRLIVWQGALDIFKHYPIFGSGVETFAYSYYNFRPVSHNLVSEWDFLYNKAHNEFLNYLSTTGLIGFLSYMAIIITFAAWCIKRYILSIKGKKDSSHNTYYMILIPSLLASYISYLVQNFFGFSVVIIALFFFLFPAIAFVATDSIQPLKIPKKISQILNTIYKILYRRPLYPKILTSFIFIISVILAGRIFQYWVADTYFANGQQMGDQGNAGQSYNELTSAVSLNPHEPFYQSELGYAAASAAVALSETEATQSMELKNQAINLTANLLKTHPKNVSFFRTAIRTYYMLSTIDKDYTQKTLQVLDQTINLAPTDAKLFYNKALILNQIGENTEAIQAAQETIKLKSNYRDAYYLLGLLYFEQKQPDLAIKQLETILKLAPNDPQAKEKLAEWGQKK